METKKNIKIEVMGVHNLFWESYARRDIELRFSLCSEDVTFIGSGLHERALNKTEYININKEGVKQFPDPFQIEFLWTKLSMLNENVACVESEVVWSQLINNEMFKELLRNTTLLKCDNNKWLITHVHGSVPDYRLKDGDYMTNDQTIIRNRELERQVFERTQDLNKTLEELKQKSRELEIETALEKVRSSALGMKKPEDMLDVCRIISDQLQSLGVNEIRNVQTAIFYETKKTYINFEYYTKHSKSIITEVDYRTHELQELFASKMMKGVEELFSETLKSKEVKDWYAYQKTTNQFADSFLETAESLSYYWYSLGPVALGMSTYIPLNEQEINLFKRFRNVFELAYRRFLDIQQAESQAKEAQIEAALEKVRAVALSLKKSDEMLDIAQALYEQLLELSFNNIRNAIIDIHNESDETFWDYDYSHDMGKTVTLMSYHDDPIIEKQVHQIESSNDAFFEIILERQDLQDLIDMRLRNGENEDPRLRQIEQLTYNLYSFGNGAIGISNFGLLSDEQKMVLKRFRNVFAFAYKRYNDLVLAETQAREAQIELALERIRARTMAMQKSDELPETTFLLFQQLKELGESAEQISIGIIKEEEGVVDLSATVHGDQLFQTYTFSISEPYLIKKVVLGWKEKKKSLVVEIKGQDLIDYNIWRNKLLGKNIFDYTNLEDKWIVNVAFFSKGFISFSSNHSVPTETIQLLERFAGVFDGTYTRFFDLQRAEAQAREAQIEAALERVRSRTMGMQKSEELKEVIKVVYEQLVHLKINVDHAGFVVDYTPKGDWHFWIADEQDIPSKITHPYFESVWANQFNEAKERGADFFATNLNFEEKNKFYNELLSYVSGLPAASKDFYLSCPGLAATTILFDNVSLYIENFSGISYSDEENKILMRFGKVFQQTYTRFLDLQKAEAQAREAQIETALERTRTQSMIMQHSKELDDTLRVFHEQVLFLGINSAFSYLWLPDEEKDRHIFWAAWGEDKIDSTVFKSKAINYPLDRNEPATAQCLVDWRSYEPLYSYHVHPDAVENYFAAWQELIDGVEQLKPEYFSGGLYYVEAFMKYGCFGVMVATDLTEDEKKILGRLATEFERTYTRFLDLQKAEAQAREANIETSLERVRSKAMAMHSPDDLSETVNVFFKELKTLGIIPIRCGVGQIDGATRTTNLTTTTSSQQGESFQVIGKIKQTGHPVLDGIFDHWKLQKEYHPVLEGEDIKDYYNVMNAQIGYPEYPEGVTQFGNCFFFKEGFVFAWTESKLSEEELQIFRRFTFVLSLTFRRYIDLKEAEVRARDAMMQSSLDRLRAEIASMRSAEDLQRITPLIWHELITLDVPFIRCGVFIVDEDNRAVQVYLSTPDGYSLGVLNLSFDANELTSNTVRHWQKKTVYTEHWNKKQFINWMQSMIEIGQIPNNKSYQGSDDPPESLNLHFVPFAQGMLYVGNTIPLTNEKIQLVKSLADAFSIAFTRYEDFKNLEDAKNRVEATLSELKSAQAQLVQAEKLASLGQLTAGIAHEIKNPLNFVNNFSELSSELLDEMRVELQNDNKEEALAIVEDIKQNLVKINQHGKRADSIVKGMLLHSRGSAGEKSLTNINDLLDQYVNLAYHGLRAQDKEFNITILKDFDETLEKINVVPQDISRVFLNIVNNGFYAANEKKKKSENDFAPILKVSTKNLPDKVEIRIRDNGNGIPQSIKNNIFNPFFTTKPTGEGTGLGLSLSYDIITKVHNGEIIFDTKENEFTEFTITIPKS